MHQSSNKIIENLIKSIKKLETEEKDEYSKKSKVNGRNKSFEPQRVYLGQKEGGEKGGEQKINKRLQGGKKMVLCFHWEYLNASQNEQSIRI